MIETKIERMKDLIKILDEASKSYYQENKEIISNHEYDKLYDELLSLEKETKIVFSNSPSNKVGYEILGSLPKKSHIKPMLSLNKTKEVNELASFLGDEAGILMWKLDGITIVLTYEDGMLKEALTRGNGEVGEVVTENARFFSNIPLKIAEFGKLVVRGEAIIHYSDFNRINNEIEDVDEKYKNPRNLCSASVRQLQTEVTAKRNISFIAYEYVSGTSIFKTRTDELKYLESLGFEVVSHPRVTAKNVEEYVLKYKEDIENIDLPSDGLVLQFDDVEYGKSLGETSKFPRHSIAFKWMDETAKTRLIRIEWSASRTGLINPVAIFEPVELEGTTVSRASVHNVSVMKNLRLGVGDEILVYKANMIIPQILENLTKGDTEEIPKKCPVCGSETVLKTEETVMTLYCPNEECTAKKIKQLSLFVSRDAMNISGLSEMTLEKFVGMGLISDIEDIFSLDKYHERIISEDGFGEKSYENLIKNIERARKEASMVRVLYGLGIGNIGLSMAKIICKRFNNNPRKIAEASFSELVEIDGIGEVMADIFTNYFQNKKNLDRYYKIIEIVDIKEEVAEEVSNELTNLSFVITGDLERFKNRKELSSLIESMGGSVKSSVTGKTNYLINNDLLSNSEKNVKAKKLGVPIITEEEFLKLINR